MPLSSIIPVPVHINASDASRIPKPTPSNGYQKVKKMDKGEQSKNTKENTKDKDTNRSESSIDIKI